MLEHVNNLEGLKHSDNESIVSMANAVLEQWNQFAAGTISREQLTVQVDSLWTPQKNQQLIDSGADDKTISFINFVMAGIKTQSLDEHVPGTE